MDWEFHELDDINEKDPWFDSDFDFDELVDPEGAICIKCKQPIHKHQKYIVDEYGGLRHVLCPNTFK